MKLQLKFQLHTFDSFRVTFGVGFEKCNFERNPFKVLRDVTELTDPNTSALQRIGQSKVFFHFSTEQCF